MEIAAIILAAGESRRMGEPKALVRYGQYSFLETVIRNFRNADIENSVVVLGHESSRILEKVQHIPAQFVINHNYSTGQFSSFQAGVTAVPNAAGAFLVLVDQPQIGSQIISTLKEAFLTNPRSISIPTFKGRRGHPPIFPRSLFQEIVSTPPTENAATIIHRHSELVREIEIEDESILWNINTKKDLEEARFRLKN